VIEKRREVELEKGSLVAQEPLLNRTNGNRTSSLLHSYQKFAIFRELIAVVEKALDHYFKTNIDRSK
jgi:hypothetical protein